MLSPLGLLVTVHMVADYPLQTDWMAANKHEDAAALLSHGLVHGGLTAGALSSTHSLIVAVGAALVVNWGHVAIDAKNLDIRWDQTAHLIHLTTLAVVLEVVL